MDQDPDLHLSEVRKLSRIPNTGADSYLNKKLPQKLLKPNQKCTWLAISRAGMMDWMEDIFFSEKRTKASLYSTLAPLLVFTKKGEMYPRSNFMPEKTGKQ